MAALRFPGRVLFLATDPGRIAAQLGGADLRAAEAGPLLLSFEALRERFGKGSVSNRAKQMPHDCRPN